MIKILRYFSLLIFFIKASSFGVVSMPDIDEAKSFISSFINHYESNPEGRYTHEYHPFLLQHTAQSLCELTSRLKSEGLNIAGRIIILGYEENAIPSYYTDFTRPKINDEAVSKKREGWTKKLHNKFGFMTAFLFKDINILSAKHFAGKTPVFDHVDFEHLDVDTIPIFDDRAGIFQEHAFGESLGLACNAYDSVVSKYIKSDYFGILKNLVEFWNIVYKNSLKTGAKEVAGTQDILFSIEHVKSLIDSKVQLCRFFVGPDLTYPIEISCKQAKGVTVHAQKFVKKIVSNLVPRNGKKTVYVFCSFVDGVGKSTMLGNIKNWMEFGDNVDAFKHVDNTSSQLADIFEYNKDVFIADLPAQISHFTYKPDGCVYTAVENELKSPEITKLKAFINNNKASITAAHNERVAKVANIIQRDGYLAPALNDISRPEFWFIKNLYLLKTLKDNKFITFSCDGVNYLFNSSNISDIRILMKLENVRSEGLKNVESEQMLFSLGIRMPFPYEKFVSDLISRLKAHEVEEVVFVDFLSMYPRSSRENLRINYLLQQLALLNQNFDKKNSFYADFVGGGGRLLSCLMDPKMHVKFRESLTDEALLRFKLYRMIQDYRHGDLTGVSINEITQALQGSFVNKKDLSYFAFLKKKVADKLELETNNLDRVYGLSKSFINVQQLSFKRLNAFSRLLQDLFAMKVDHQRLNDLWSSCGMLLPEPSQTQQDSGACDLFIRTSSNTTVHAIYSFDPECKSDQVLTPFLRTLRQNWYAAISNILQSRPKCGFDGKILIEREFIRVLPYFLDIGKDGNYYIFHRTCSPYIKDDYNPNFFGNLKVFNQPRLPMQNKCVDFADVPYLAYFPPVVTNCGVFGFDCNLANLKNNIYVGSCTGYIVQKNQIETDSTYVMPTSKLSELMEKADSSWKWLHDWMVKEAEKNKEFKPIELLTEELKSKTDAKKGADQKQAEDSSLNNSKNNIVGRATKIYLGRKNQRAAARLFVRLIATLEMILKDPDGDLAVRFGDRKDFVSAIQLLEMVTIPNYFGILFKQKLFKNYENVEPYPSWNFWNSVG